MTDQINNLLPENIQALKAYSSAKSEKLTGNTWLNANESPYAREFELDANQLNRYPDPQPQSVIDAYADYASVKAEQVLMTRGADEGIELLVRTFCQPQADSITIFAPTYGMYKVTADTHNVALNVQSQDLLLNGNCEEIVQSCAQSKLIFICNPNNPTGALLPCERIAEITAALASKAIVVVDEAYIEFCEQNTSVNLLRDFENLVILRTLSKAFALAGLRCGFMLANDCILQPVKKVIAPYPVSTIVAQVAEQALTKSAITQMRRQVSILNRAKEQLFEVLQANTEVTKVLPSSGNFITLQLKNKASISTAMHSGLIMRPFELYEQDNWLRISIGNEQELKQVQNWLDAIS